MLAFSLAGAPLSASHDATLAVNLLYCRSPISGQNSADNSFLLFIAFRQYANFFIRN